MRTSWTAYLLLGMDSLVAAGAISPLLCSARVRWRLIGLFGLCDGLAVALGSAFGVSGLWRDVGAWLGPAFAVVYGLYCLLASQWNRFKTYPELVWLLPPLLSLDNFAAALDGRSGAVEAVVLGVTSAAFAGAGFSLGGLLNFSTQRARQRTAGAAMLCAGGLLLLV